MKSASSLLFAYGFICINVFQYGHRPRSQVRFCAILIVHLNSLSLLHVGFLPSKSGPLLPIIAVETALSERSLSPLHAFLRHDLVSPGHLPCLNLTVTPLQLQPVLNSSYALSSRMIQPFALRISGGGEMPEKIDECDDNPGLQGLSLLHWPEVLPASVQYPGLISCSIWRDCLPH